jgi:hypothetical protein
MNTKKKPAPVAPKQQPRLTPAAAARILDKAGMGK